MRIRTSLYLALRYLKIRRSFTSISTLLSIVGPIIGVAVLVVVISVMNGFHDEIRKRHFGFIAHLLIDNYNEPIDDPDEVLDALSQFDFQGTPVIEGPVMVQIHKDLKPAALVGVDTDTDRYVTKIRERCLVEYKTIDGEVHTQSFQNAYDNLIDGEIIVGYRFLRQNGLRIGDRIVIHSLGKLKNNIEYREDGSVKFVEAESSYLPEELEVVGVVSFDMADYDSNVIISTLDKAADIKGLAWGQATRIKVKTSDPFQYFNYIPQMYRTPTLSKYQIWSWKEENKQFFAALQMEKTMMFILLVLIVVVSAFCVCATLITIVFQKSHEIGVMKAMGASPMLVTEIFFLQGAIIGTIGVGGGLLLGIFMTHIRNDFLAFVRKVFSSDIMPVDLYFFTELPASIQSSDLSIIAISTMILCIVAGVLPAFMASIISPSKAIKGDA